MQDLIQYHAQRFLESQQAVVKKLIKEGERELRGKWSKEKSGICAEFVQNIEFLRKKYLILEREKQTGKLEYIQISFLRIGVLLQEPWYRIDFYDENWQISEVECAVRWQPVFLTEALQNAQAVLNENFLKQSSAGLYEYEQMVLEIAEKFHLLFSSLLPEIFPQIEGRQESLFREPVTICIGEFLDSSLKIYCGKL